MLSNMSLRKVLPSFIVILCLATLTTCGPQLDMETNQTTARFLTTKLSQATIRVDATTNFLTEFPPEETNETMTSRAKYLEVLLVFDDSLLDLERRLPHLKAMVPVFLQKFNKIMAKLGIHIVVRKTLKRHADHMNITLPESTTLTDYLRIAIEEHRRPIYASFGHDVMMILTSNDNVTSQNDLSANMTSPADDRAISYQRVMCSLPESIAILRVKPIFSQELFTVDELATNAAYQTGQIIGLLPEDTTNPKRYEYGSCKVDSKNTTCVMQMTRKTGVVAKEWSSNSVNSLQEIFSSGRVRCLDNKPIGSMNDQGYLICGNGIVETGLSSSLDGKPSLKKEQCDCLVSDKACRETCTPGDFFGDHVCKRKPIKTTISETPSKSTETTLDTSSKTISETTNNPSSSESSVETTTTDQSQKWSFHLQVNHSIAIIIIWTVLSLAILVALNLFVNVFSI